VADVERVLVADHGYAPVDARAAAVDAGGSVGRALLAEAADVAEALTDARTLLALAMKGGDAGRRIQTIKDMFPKKSTPAGDREHLAARLRAVASLVRDVGLLAEGAGSALLAHGDLEAELKRLAATVDADRATACYGVIDQALAALDRNASAKIVADWVAVRL
jgi:hypothetical protein